ncbi:MAG: class I SAM-dependent methyltransferase [Pirellulaceae bacterium]
MAISDRDKWNQKYLEATFPRQEPSPLIVAHSQYLPAPGRAIDLAGGNGNHALWLAQLGFEVTLADISQVALDQAASHARHEGLALQTCCLDLEEDPFPAGPWSLILSHLYLYRPLFPDIKNSLAPGGILICAQPTKTNLSRHARPPARYLLDDDELPELVEGLEILSYQQGWSVSGRHDAIVVARKASAGKS